ncbi:hypothetical protein J4E83_008933 [Alternaria metachromatica]|uniref:uncharacterized protein n=1 Tax=Alternaria metachromatica TaxID=283354 RepID=UPI0020C488CD|nr:uncharacterized protein J4E83_008933 [Alternaria metachromatica]KAI4608894.1 hypothetical protein J4E83_008933 [Alternaria metachromatica]
MTSAPRIAEHQDAYRTYGPPPSNFYMSRTTTGMIYADHSSSTVVTTKRQGASSNHPYSIAGQAAHPRPGIAGEKPHTRVSTMGLFPPPVEYVPGSTRWRWHQDGWSSAFAAAAAQKGITQTADQIQQCYDDLTTHPDIMAKKSALLYDPIDRDTAVFRDESTASLVARYGSPETPFSLVIICPPPIYARWSTGEQAIHEPLVLMCIPKIETRTGRESYNKDADWFSVDPNPGSDFENEFNLMSRRWSEEDLVTMMGHLSFPTQLGSDALRWTLVRLHRCIAMGEQVDDNDLGCWIEQYGQYLLRRNDDPPPAFRFNANRSYTGRLNVRYRQLTAMVLNRKLFPSDPPSFARRWDDAIQALIAYNLEQDNEKSKELWSSFRKLLNYASRP